MPTFTGFPKDTLKFLRELEANNNREWFADNKHRYEALVREPALDFIATMGPEIEKLSMHFTAIPKKTGGSLMRVYRDTRFGRNKTPYKTNIGIQFRHELAKDVHAPGYYLHIDNTGCFLATGVWHPEPDALKQIRARIDEQPDEWIAARDAADFAAVFELGGTSLKRSPRDYPQDHPLIDDLKRKDFIASTTIDARDIHSAAFVRQVSDAFASADRFMAFLCRALEVNF